MHVGISLDYTLFIQLGLFLVFMFVMKKVYFDPYLQAFEERETTVKKLLEEAEVNNRQAQEILKEVDAILSKVKEESKKILDESSKETNQIVADIIRKAQEEAEKEIEEAKKDIDRVAEIEIKALDTTIEKIAEKIVDKLTLKEKAA
ncbi:ATP synthase F0, B subunit [Sulfurihydrogenibium azorense Az-Fu1]|uniref:ATP synthase subunit b n=1 Tax=Sulfurihydrogenibium azorense (strain DSM 15241 / OCM 825 / Az-Fu1) TaxID=204536 RepID=C1DTL0_SULAA|nr:ATP synthase F0 subunit B [Sulfurihydrogenibium azorense]ACN98179.1 ATP synthase F0, B subunit [Sulfurihydrogenibium azorense Az-Fu1]